MPVDYGVRSRKGLNAGRFAIPEKYEASRKISAHQAFGRLRLRGQVDA